ncbi:MAG: dihydroneopterin aldolase [Leadbetterella sp.]|nr:dihydroneopterin aldolase [Leadbetterella sp.]
MGQITLEGMEFFAYHGLSDEEQKTGNRYGVDICIDTDLGASGRSDDLSDTVDYGRVYALVAEEMQTKSRLLEHIGYRIMARLKEEFTGISKVKLHVSKFNPPVGGIVQRSKITIEESFIH